MNHRRTHFFAVALLLLLSACSADNDNATEAASGEATETSQPRQQAQDSASSTEEATTTTSPLPLDLDTPPTDFYDPPLDLSGLVGRTVDEARAWGERQGFTRIAVVPPDGDQETDSDPNRLNIYVDDSGLQVVDADQG